MAASVFRPDRRTFVVALLAALPGAYARAEERPLIIGTSTPGGGFALYGETLERILNARAGRALIRARPTRGTTENLALLQNGEIDAALIQGTAASALLAQGPSNGLRILFAMYPSPGMLAVPTVSPIVRLEDVVGRRVVLGVRTSGLVTLGRQVFSGIGIDVDRDLQAIYVDEAAAAPRIVLAGDAVGLWGAGEGWPGFLQLARSPDGARFIGPSPAQIPKIVAAYPLLTAMEVAVGAYPGIERPLATVGSMNWIMTRADLDTTRAAVFVEAMDEAAADLAAALPQAAFSTLANTRASAPSAALLHPALAPTS
ncbi:MAG: TAXI family TRAP transporter solute-binding subunit [Burkholderiaceae bacterium]